MKNDKRTGFLTIFDVRYFKLSRLITLALPLLSLISCSVEGTAKHKKIEWIKVFNTNEEADFCQVDNDFSAKDQFIISYSSFPVIGGDIHIKSVGTENSNSGGKDLFQDNRSGLFSVSRQKDSIIGFIQCRFRENQLQTTLRLSFNKGDSWVEKKTPLADLLKLYIYDSILFVQGNLDRAGQLFKSTDFGNNWQEVTGAGQGYQHITLINAPVFNNKLFCIGSIDFFKKNRLFLLDIETNAIREIGNINDVNSYVKPISKDFNIHAIVTGNYIDLYTYIDDDLKHGHKFQMPQQAASVHNLFINDELYILTGENDQGTIVSWVSYEKGKQWEIYNQDKGYKLVYSPDGELFMSDEENNILKGIIATFAINN